MSTTLTSQRLLNYAPWQRNRQWKRWTVFFTIGVLTILLSLCAPRTLDRVNKCIAVSRCLRYEAPPDRIVHDEDVSRSGGLLARNAPYVQTRCRTQTAVEYDCLPWKALRLPKDWYVCYPIFLHELTSPCGNHRLVVVFMCPGQEMFGFYVLKFSLFGDPRSNTPVDQAAELSMVGFAMRNMSFFAR